MGDENHENGRVSSAIAGREQDKNTPAARPRLFRGRGPDQQAHEQPEIVPGDVDQIALMDVLPAPQPRPAQTTPVQDVSKRALNEFRPFAALLHGSGRWRPGPGWSSWAAPLLTPGCPPCPSS